MSLLFFFLLYYCNRYVLRILFATIPTTLDCLQCCLQDLCLGMVEPAYVTRLQRMASQYNNTLLISRARQEMV